VQGDGVVAGEQQVTFTKLESAAPLVPYDEDSPPSVQDNAVRSLIPEHYGERGKSGLTAVVSEEGKNQFRFELKD